MSQQAARSDPLGHLTGRRAAYKHGCVGADEAWGSTHTPLLVLKGERLESHGTGTAMAQCGGTGRALEDLWLDS